MILISTKIQRKKETIFGLMIISGKNILKKIKKIKKTFALVFAKVFFLFI